MAKVFVRERNAPVAKSEIQAEAMEEIKPKIVRSFAVGPGFNNVRVVRPIRKSGGSVYGGFHFD